LDGRPARRGVLHVYLGAAPGVGKTYAMLTEGARLAAAGVDVVVGAVELHDRDDLVPLLDGFECIATRQIAYRSAVFDAFDLDAVLSRAPDVVLVDELAHPNPPGAEHGKRWQDVASLLEHGIDVISTVNIQHLDSLNLDVERILGVEQRETVPDLVVEAAHRVDLVDPPTLVISERLAAGRIYSPDRGALARDRALQPARIEALRALAKRWLAEHRPGPPRRFGGSHRGGVVVAALTGTPEGDRVVRRAAELADARDATPVGVHVREPSGLVEVRPAWLEHQRALLEECGGRYAEVGGVDVVRAVLDFARAEGADEVVIGATRRSRTDEWLHGPLLPRFAKQAGPIELHVVPAPATRPTLDRVGIRRRPVGDRVALPARRRRIGWSMAAVLPVVVLFGLLPARASLGVAGALFAVLIVVVLAAAVGGRAPALLATLLGFVLADFLFTRPYYSLRIDRLLDIVALVAFAIAAVVIGALVDHQGRQGLRIARADAVAEGLARLAADQVGARADAAPEVFAALRRTFDLDAVAVLDPQEHGWEVLTSAGSPVPRSPKDASFVVELSDGRILALGSKWLDAPNPQLLRAFVTELRLVRESDQLRRMADEL
jgi:two-component system, OmpR family, sensor histidine kinase KdpD